jgi:bacterioferritin-associated ferredoxin
MYICICNGITERAVRAAAAEGVHSLSELTLRTGCGGCCGSCTELAEQVLREAHDTLRENAAVPLAAAA